MNNSRKSAKLRREEILRVAVEIATSCGLPAVSGGAIARRLGVSRPAVSYHIGDIASLRNDVMRVAVDMEILSILVHGLTVRNPIAMAAPTKLRRRAAESLL